MKLYLAVVAVVVAALAQFFIIDAPANAEATPGKKPSVATAPASDLSVVRKKKEVPRRVSGWRAADPSFVPDGRLYPRPNYMGDCVLDMGYGRWDGCSNK